MACWTLVDGDWDLVANKCGPTRLGFCLMLKFFEIEGRFPEFIEEVPQPAVEYVAGLVKVPAADLAKYDLAGAKRHRKQIREALGFRPPTAADEERLAEWLSTEVCPVELVEDRQREALLVQCRVERIEPPGRARVEKVLVTARNRWERAFCTRTIERLGEVGTAINTLLLQQALAEPAWAKKLSDEDRRGLTALFWSNIKPYGTFRLEMDKRLDLGLTTAVPRPRSAGSFTAPRN